MVLSFYVYVYNLILLFVDATPVADDAGCYPALIGVFLQRVYHHRFIALMAWWAQILALGGALGLLVPRNGVRSDGAFRSRSFHSSG